MRTLFTFLLIISLFCSGFTWGKTKEESCKEATDLLFNQQMKNPELLSDDLEQKVTDLCPDGAASIIAESLVQQGDEYSLHSDFTAAVRSYNNAAEKNITPEIYKKLGDAFLAVGNDDDALIKYQKSLSISPDDADVHYSAGVVLERKGDNDKAVAEYERCISLGINNGDAHRRLADIYAQRGNLQKAIAEYRQILVNSPNDPSIHFRLAKMYLRDNMTSDAKSSFEAAVKLDPKNLEPRRELVKIELKRKYLPRAEKLCREILAINRDDQQERAWLVGILGQQKKYTELAKFLTEECTRYPKKNINYYKLGIVREYLKDYRRAIQAFLKSIEIKPSVLSYQALARVYLSISETKKAREGLIEANRLDPKRKDTKQLLELIDKKLSRADAVIPRKPPVNE